MVVVEAEEVILRRGKSSTIFSFYPEEVAPNPASIDSAAPARGSDPGLLRGTRRPPRSLPKHLIRELCIDRDQRRRKLIKIIELGHNLSKFGFFMSKF